MLFQGVDLFLKGNAKNLSIEIVDEVLAVKIDFSCTTTDFAVDFQSPP